MAWVAHRGRWMWVGSVPPVRTKGHAPAASPLDLQAGMTCVSSRAFGPAAGRAAGSAAGGSGTALAPGAQRPPSGERLRRRQAAQDELVAYYKATAAAEERARESGGGHPTSGAVPPPAGAEGSAEASGSADGEPECPICLEPLGASQVVRGHACGHALHMLCLANLVGYNSTSCPQCRASLVPPHLVHLAPSLGAVVPRRGASQNAAGAAGVPGMEPRASGTNAMEWDGWWADDSDGDADDLEAGRRGDVGRRSTAGSVDGGTLVMALRLRAQNVSVLRAICAKISLAVFLTLVGLVMFLLIGSFARPSSHASRRQ